MSEKKQVLIICHTAAGQMYLGVLLNRIWYSPVLAKTPEEGIHLARTIAFSLIIFDGETSENEMARVISLLRSEPSITSIPLIVFTTSGNAISGQALLTQGCSAVLTKPLDLAIVYGVLARLSGQPRTTPRIPVKLRVDIEEGIPEKQLTCINLSEGGIYLRTVDPLPEGTVLHVNFKLPLDTETITLEARVVRTLQLGISFEADPGMGLHFVDVPETVLMRIRNFVQWEMMGDLEWKSNI